MRGSCFFVQVVLVLTLQATLMTKSDKVGGGGRKVGDGRWGGKIADFSVTSFLNEPNIFATHQLR